MKSLGSLALLCLLVTTTLAKSQEPGLVADKQVIFRNQPETHVESARLIQLGENEAPLWMTEYDILQLIRQGKKFMDVTDSRDYTTKTMTVTRASKIPAEPGHKDQVQQFIDDLNAENMKQSLTKFTSFHNRYYKSPWGAKSCRWLLSKVQEIAAPAGDRVSVRKFEHRWNQFSIIARFEGSNPDLADELVIIGAHQDSVNMWLPDFGRSPGADDDGSGTVTILEAFRSLVDNGFAPERPVEFHWYSAEEGGLLGSQAIAQNYTDSNKEIVGMIQNDMTGYVGGHEPTMGVITDYVDQKLTDFIKSLIDNYCSLPYVETKCGYACSDHASWRKHGFPSGFVIESSFDDSSPHIHTSGDTLDKLSIDHMKEFAKLSIGFAVELSHAISE